MGNRLSKIYTRTGDQGTTGLGDGERVAKTHVRIEAYGTVDEANSAIGMVLAVAGIPDNIAQLLTRVQHELFDLGSELAVPGYRVMQQEHIDVLEQRAGPAERRSADAQGIHPAGGRTGDGGVSSGENHDAACRARSLESWWTASRWRWKCRST